MAIKQMRSAALPPCTSSMQDTTHPGTTFTSRVRHLFDTMVEAHCVQGEGTNADQWLVDWANLIGLGLGL